MFKVPILPLISKFRALPLAKKIVVGLAVVALLVVGGIFLSRFLHAAAGFFALLFGGDHYVSGRRVAPVPKAARKLAKELRKDAAEATAAADLAPVHAADDAAAAVVAENAAEAATGAEKAASEGWRKSPHRKPPTIPCSVLFFAAAIGALGAVGRARADDDGCKVATPGSSPPPGFGYWHEADGDFYCPCLSSIGDFYDANRMPGGCKAPDMLPLVAYTIGDNARMWGDLDKGRAEIAGLKLELKNAQDDRDSARIKLAECGVKLQRAADAIDNPAPIIIPDAPSRLEWFGYGFGTAAVVGLAVALLR